MKPYDASHFDHDCCKPFFLEGGDNAVLLLHGFTGSVAEMRPLGDALHARGYTVRGINLPGHATTESEMGTTRWADWLQAAKLAALELREKYKTVTVSGLSMGGVLSLLVAEQMKMDGCVPISAPMATKSKLIGFASLLWPFLPRVSWQNQEARHAGLDKAYDYGYSGFPTRCAGDLHHLIQLARRNLFAINCPVLTVQSEADPTIWEGSADCILQGVSSQSKKKLWLKDVPHVCTLSKELPAIIDAMDDFLQAVAQEAR